MMRSATILASIFAIGLVACGGGGGDDDGDDTAVPDAGLPNAGFVPPDHVTEANENEASVGPADWTCLNTPSTDVPTDDIIALDGTVTDFQNGNPVREATVEVFGETDYQNPFTTAGPTLNDGLFSVDLEAGHARYGFKISAPDYMDTFLLNQDFLTSDGLVQSQDISAISEGVATALPAIIGLVRTPGTGVLAGALRDCQGREVSYAVATVSGTSGEADHLENAVTYYLDTGSSLPVRHDQLAYTDTIGIFAVFELPVTASAFVQVWGFVDDADLADGEMTLLSETESPVVADTVITGSFEPLRN